MAMQRQRPGAGLIHHSDRVRPAEAERRHGLLHRPDQSPEAMREKARFVLRISARGIRSRFLRRPALLSPAFGPEYPDRDTARRDLFAYIEGYYNRRRIHSAIGYITPQQAEAKYA